LITYAAQKTSDEVFDKFIRTFECRIEDSREYNQYVKPMPYYRDVCSSEDWRMETKITPMKAIHLTKDNLARLVSQEEQIEHLKNDAEYGRQSRQDQRRDSLIRDQNPSVEKAYQKYLFLLELARK
jgi:hypothetical protein